MQLKVKAKLDHMESQGVISKVTAPTPWGTGTTRRSTMSAYTQLWKTLRLPELLSTGSASSTAPASDFLAMWSVLRAILRPKKSGSHSEHATTHHHHQAMQVHRNVESASVVHTTHQSLNRWGNSPYIYTKNHNWTWGPWQAKAFQGIKEVLTTTSSRLV